MARGFNYAPGASPEVEEAMQPGLHRAHVQALSQSKNWLVREVIAGRADCPLGVMVGLAHDSHAEVRAAVAANPAAARTVMEHLTRDRSLDVLVALIHNPSLDADLVEGLAFHKKAEVRAAASARLDSGVTAAPSSPQDHVPELREQVEAYDESRVYDISTGRPMELNLEPVPPPVAERQVPTRTAPVRGFRVDNVG